MANYSQRYNATTQTTTAGAFKFDTISSVDWPVAKLIWGAEGVATYASAADPLPVTISGVATAALQTTGNGILTTIDADTGNIATSAASIDGKITACNTGAVVVSSMPTVAVTGTFWQATQPISGTVTVNSLPAGTNNIGDVDVLSLPALPTGTNSIGQVTTNAGTNTSTAALALEGGGNLAAINSVLSSTIADALETIRDNTTDTLSSVNLIDDAIVTDGGATGKFIGLAAYDEADTGTMKSLKFDNATAGLMVTIVGSTDSIATITAGTVAHDSADSGSPVKTGARAAGTLSNDTMVADADRVDNVADLDGCLMVRPGFPLGDLISERVTDTSGTSTAFSNFGAVSSTRSYITAIVVYNSSATAGTIDFRDGTSGSVLYTVPIPATGGAVISNGGAPLFRTSANTALAYDVSGALTTVTISITGFKSKV